MHSHDDKRRPLSNEQLASQLRGIARFHQIKGIDGEGMEEAASRLILGSDAPSAERRDVLRPMVEAGIRKYMDKMEGLGGDSGNVNINAMREEVLDALQGSASNAEAPTQRDWPEDFGDENGNYSNTCHACQREFRGYKRRVTCKLCAPSHVAAPSEFHTETMVLVRQLLQHLDARPSDDGLDTARRRCRVFLERFASPPSSTAAPSGWREALRQIRVNLDAGGRSASNHDFLHTHGGALLDKVEESLEALPSATLTLRKIPLAAKDDAKGGWTLDAKFLQELCDAAALKDESWRASEETAEAIIQVLIEQNYATPDGSAAK